ncbi:hypothetical protein EDB89DRAFT_2242781 [Lactarius sanguifluus]|nr:hypothetical protein EDB89DRAFT_2242781 [Lactarius sanguifluus]
MCVIESSSPHRQFAFTILCDLASAGKSCWMLQCPSNFSRIPTSLSSLSWHGFKRRQLGQRTSCRNPSGLLDALLKCFISAKADMPPFDADRDRHREGAVLPTRLGELSDSKAVVKLNLLCILRAVCDVHPNHALLIEFYGIHEAVAALLRKDRDVRERSSLASYPSDVPIRPRVRPRRGDVPRGALPGTCLMSARRRPRWAWAR